jgi:hypothetical protein
MPAMGVVSMSAHQAQPRELQLVFQAQDFRGNEVCARNTRETREISSSGTDTNEDRAGNTAARRHVLPSLPAKLVRLRPE